MLLKDKLAYSSKMHSIIYFLRRMIQGVNNHLWLLASEKWSNMWIRTNILKNWAETFVKIQNMSERLKWFSVFVFIQWFSREVYGKVTVWWNAYENKNIPITHSDWKQSFVSTDIFCLKLMHIIEFTTLWNFFMITYSFCGFFYSTGQR